METDWMVNKPVLSQSVRKVSQSPWSPGVEGSSDIRMNSTGL